MHVYFGGQIRQEKRGKEAVVIARGDKPGTYEAFMYTADSEEFHHLTGVRTVRYPIERVYMSISREAAEHIVEEVNRGSLPEAWRIFDSDVVYSRFLQPIQEDELLDERERQTVRV